MAPIEEQVPANNWYAYLPSASEFSLGGRSVDQYPFYQMVAGLWWSIAIANMVLFIYSAQDTSYGWFLPIVFVLYSTLIFSLKASSHILYQMLPMNPTDTSTIEAPLNHKFRVLSLNFYLRAGGVSDLDGDHKNERLDGFLENYADGYDILVFQEVFATLAPRRNRLIREAKALGFHYHAVSPPPDWLSFFCFDAGLLVLSRYPIVDSHFMQYDSGCYSDSMSNKGVLFADVQLRAGVHFHIFNTHLQATYSLRDPVAEKVQMEQILQLASFTSSKSTLATPSLLCADLNIDANPPLSLQDETREDDGSNERSEMYQLLSSRLHVSCIDLMYQQHGRHFPTCKSNFDACGADVGTRPRPEEERKLKNYVELGMTLDYQFFKPTDSSQVDEREPTIKHICTSKPVAFHLPEIPYYGKASDHWGIESQFEISTSLPSISLGAKLA